jgi:ATP-dependent Lon protease
MERIGMFFEQDPDRKGGRPQASVPLLPLRDIVLFPHNVSQLFVGRERSIAALDEAMGRDKEVFLAAQRSAKTNEPRPEDIFEVGTIGVIVQLLRLPDGTVKVLVEGKKRARIQRFVDNESYFLVDYEELSEPAGTGLEVEALMRSALSSFETYVKLNNLLQRLFCRR